MTMRRFFEEHRLDNDGLSKARVKKIKTSVLARIEEDKPMSKRFKFKPFVIAAAVIATTAMSAVTVNALSSGDDPPIKINGKTVDAYFTSYVDECGHTVDIYVVEYPEEILMNPPKDADPAPVGELKAVHNFDVDDSVVLVDEAGNEFPFSGGNTGLFGKEVLICIQKDGESGHNYSHDGGGVKPEYGMEMLYNPSDKSLSIEYHKNLFNTIGDIFNGE